MDTQLGRPSPPRRRRAATWSTTLIRARRISVTSPSARFSPSIDLSTSEALPRGAPQHSQIDRRALAREAGRIELLLAAERYGSRVNSLQKIRNQVKLALRAILRF